MAESLIYGKTVFEFGAVGDGKADDTEAFEKAFKSSESLICIPYGTYNISKQLYLKSGMKISCHKRAVINFHGISATGITISGGIWNCLDKEECAFDFSESTDCIIENAEIRSASDCVIGLYCCKHIIIENTVISSANTASGIILGGDITFLKLCDIRFERCTNAIEIASGCYAYGIFADRIKCNNCACAVFSKNSRFENSVIYDISGQTTENALHFEGGEIADVAFRKIYVYDGYIYIDGCKMLSLSIDGFRRLSETEADISKPSVTLKECPECTAIFDGISLDAIILAKKSVPDVKMTAAKMASVSPAVYNYTVELPISRKDNFIIPTGSFESFTAFSAE